MVNEWQPIDTAPKDGTPIVVWHNGDYHIARWSPLWTENNKTWLVRHPDWTGGHPTIVSEIEPNEFQRRAGLTGPTHWMPLPAAPQEPHP